MIFQKKHEKSNDKSLRIFDYKNKNNFFLIVLYLIIFLFVNLSFFFTSQINFNFNPSFQSLYADDLIQNQTQDQVVKKVIPSSRIDIAGTSGIVINYKTGQVLWQKNPDMQLYPASTTKMITAILAIENIKDLNKKIKISKNAAGTNFSSISFRKGDEITLMDLLKAALICSANNAAIALAEYVSGNEKNFVNLMNEKAKQLGALNTNFENTNGLDNKSSNKSTARDLAIIASYCMKNELFKELVSIPKTTIHINNKEINIKNTNTLLGIDYIKGIKTGYTEKAGYCIVTYSNKNGLELITVILNSSFFGKNYDAMRLINWVYDSYINEKLINSKIAFLKLNIKTDSSNYYYNLYPEEDFEYFLNKADDKVLYNYFIYDDINLPLIPGKTYGKIILYINNEKVKEINLIFKDS